MAGPIWSLEQTKTSADMLLVWLQARSEALEQRLARSRQEAASASTLLADLEERLRRAEDEIEAAAGVRTSQAWIQ